MAEGLNYVRICREATSSVTHVEFHLTSSSLKLFIWFNLISLVFLGSTWSDLQGLHKIQRRVPHHAIIAHDQGWPFSRRYQKLQIPTEKIHHYIQTQRVLSRETFSHIRRNLWAFLNHKRTWKCLIFLYVLHTLGISLWNLVSLVFSTFFCATFFLWVHRFHRR